jgi:HEAT repeat protein
VGRGGVRVADRLVVIRERQHLVAEGVPEKFLNGYGEQILVSPGPQGTVVAVNSGGAPVLVLGEFHAGRVALYSSYVHDDYHPTLNPHGTGELLPAETNLLKNLLRWLAGSLREANEAEMAQFQLSFARREKILAEMNEDQRVDSTITKQSAVVAEAYWDLLEPLDRCADQGRYYGRVVPDDELKTFAAEVEELKAKVQAEKQRLFLERRKAIEAASLADLKALDMAAFRAEFLRALQALIEKSGVLGRWAEIDAKHRPRVLKRIEERNAAAVREDAAKVPTLIATLASADAEARRHAVVELGRIGDGRAAEALLLRLDDPDPKVRIAAIQATGWLRSSKAVPRLVAMARDESPRIRRRVAQALGILGDRAASDALVRLLDDPDHYVRENAVYSLGWLRDSKAVPALTAHFKRAGQEESRGMFESAAVLHALGEIGDEQALPFLKSVQGDCAAIKTMYPAEQWYSGDFYWTAGSLQEHACLAVRKIRTGKREPPGITQPVGQALHENFHWISPYYYRGVTGRNRVYPFNARPRNLMHYPAYLSELGATGDLVSGASYPADNLPGATYEDFLSECDLMGVRVVDKIPLVMSFFGKAATALSLGTFGHHPSFAGYWGEEVLRPLELQSPQAENAAFYPPAWLQGRVKEEDFKSYLLSKRGAEALAKEALAEPFWKEFRIPRSTEAMAKLRVEQPFVWAEFMEFLADLLLENWEEWQLWTAGVRKGTVGIWSHSEMLKFGASNFIRFYPNAGRALTADGPQSYNEHSWKNVFQVDLTQDGESQPVIPEIYAWYAPTPEYVKRGMLTSLAHGGAFFEWYVQHVGRYMCPYWPWQWEAGRWDVARDVFQRGQALSEYLMPVRPPEETALLFSGRTNDLLYGQENPTGFGSGKCGGRYFQNQQGLWQALLHAHRPVTTIWGETLTASKLAPYKVLLLSNAMSLTANEEGIIRQWVEQGGQLIATGSSTRCDAWGRAEPNYRLAEVFGVRRTGSTVPFRYDPEHTNPVELQIKPEQGRGRLICPEGFPVKDAEFLVSLGYERVEPTTAAVVARYDNGDVALTRNRHGKGTCTYLTLEFPGISYTPWKYSGDSIRKTYWPGVVEFLASLVQQCLEARGERSIISVENCPEYVEVTIRRQDEKKRWMVHALNYDPDITKVPPFQVMLRPPSLRDVRVEAPLGKGEVASQVVDGRVHFACEGLTDHQVWVVSWR